MVEEEEWSKLSQDIFETVKNYFEKIKVEEKDLNDVKYFKETCEMLKSLHGNAQRQLIER